MISLRRVSTVLCFCVITGFLTANSSIAGAQLHAPAFHSVPFHAPVVHAPPIHITPLHVEPIHVAPIHSEPVHVAPVHSQALSHVTAPHLPSASHASSSSSFHAAPSARSTSPIGLGSFSHHGSGSGGRGGGAGGGGGKGFSLSQTFNKASVTSIHHSSAAPTSFKAHTSSSFSGRSKGLHYRGERAVQGERTFQSQVAKAVKEGNPTVARGGKQLLRFREDGHGMAASVQPRNVRNVSPSGEARLQKGPDRPVNRRDMKELYKMQTGQNQRMRDRRGR